MGSCYAAQKRTESEEPPASRASSGGQTTAQPLTQTSTAAASLRLLQYRELTPEDFELLSQLDERVPRKGGVPQSLVDLLPQVRASDCGARDCAVCLCALRPDAIVRRLPCTHAFCPKCIDSWLTEYKGECPVCRLPVDYPPTSEPSTRGSSISTDGDSDPESIEWVDAQVPRRRSTDVCVTRCEGIGKRLAYRL
uniref:RING-type domain-containing protein n=1 Tax=Alexandrium catenella TaxID=2925 RepID=A0A7S1WT14_ALECA|mmetsp:Transcript_86584/g.229962  ORF Transcript_86584/g.229962 Transcript_86584/m.229962 type:complete len:195 (+) Transcript_86584:80-664(+)